MNDILSSFYMTSELTAEVVEVRMMGAEEVWADPLPGDRGWADWALGPGGRLQHLQHRPPGRLPDRVVQLDVVQ